MVPAVFACGPTEVGDPLYTATLAVTVAPPAGGDASGGIIEADAVRSGFSAQLTLGTVAPGSTTVNLSLSNFADGPFTSAITVVATPPAGSGWAPDTVVLSGVAFTSRTANPVSVSLAWQ